MQAFVNTHYDLTGERGGERLVSPDSLRDWLAVHDLGRRHERLNPDDLDRAISVREGLRALAFANNDQT